MSWQNIGAGRFIARAATPTFVASARIRAGTVSVVATRWIARESVALSGWTVASSAHGALVSAGARGPSLVTRTLSGPCGRSGTVACPMARAYGAVRVWARRTRGPVVCAVTRLTGFRWVKPRITRASVGRAALPWPKHSSRRVPSGNTAHTCRRPAQVARQHTCSWLRSTAPSAPGVE